MVPALSGKILPASGIAIQFQNLLPSTGERPWGIAVRRVDLPASGDFLSGDGSVAVRTAVHAITVHSVVDLLIPCGMYLPSELPLPAAALSGS